MTSRVIQIGLIVLLFAIAGWAQDSRFSANSQGWQSRNATTPFVASNPAPANYTTTAQPLPYSQQGITQLMQPETVLPRSQGQVWRTYDIRPFTTQYSPADKPQQQIVDWIMRETGSDLWFGEPFGILNASFDRLHVYHTLEIQAQVHDMLDRFTSAQSRTHFLTYDMIAVRGTDWRGYESALTMTPVTGVQSDGVEAWRASKDVAARFIADLKRRNDIRLYPNSKMFVQNGESKAQLSTKAFTYQEKFIPDMTRGGALVPHMRTLDLGYALELSPLKSLNGRDVDAVVKCDINQIERMEEVTINLQDAQGRPSPQAVLVPQMVNWRLHERFRWPIDQVLVLVCRVAISKTETEGQVSTADFNNATVWMDVMLFLEAKPNSQEFTQNANSNSAGGAFGRIR